MARREDDGFRSELIEWAEAIGFDPEEAIEQLSKLAGTK
jgi:hypothetical protein